MESASYVSMSRQQVLEQAMEVIANNLANASTNGFKERQAIFEDFVQTGIPGQKVDYVKDAGTTRDVRQGDMKVTGNPLDAALEGDGYYALQTAAGTRYTRASSFHTTPSGQLVTAQGDEVLDDRGNPIQLPTTPGNVLIATDGTISKGNVRVSKLGVVTFDNPQQLVEESAGRYTTQAQPNPDTTTAVRQGVVELSNVQSVIEMTRMLSVQGAYADTSQIMNAEDTRLKNAIDKLSRVA
jgi:flagellar basal-body rod protein FlgF